LEGHIASSHKSALPGSIAVEDIGTIRPRVTLRIGDGRDMNPPGHSTHGWITIMPQVPQSKVWPRVNVIVEEKDNLPAGFSDANVARCWEVRVFKVNIPNLVHNPGQEPFCLWLVSWRLIHHDNLEEMGTLGQNCR